MKTYSIQETDFYSSIDSKLGNKLISLIHHKENKIKNRKISQITASNLNFKLPQFPFCRTCNKNNSEFLKNKEFLVMNDDRNSKILYPKDLFIRKLASGSLKMSNNLGNIKLIKKAIEDYQIDNGASPERDVDYSTMKLSTPTILQHKLKIIAK